MKERYMPWKTGAATFAAIFPNRSQLLLHFFCTWWWMVFFVGQGVGVIWGRSTSPCPYPDHHRPSHADGLGRRHGHRHRFGRGDTKGRQRCFPHLRHFRRHSVLLMLAGMIFSRPVAAISGANGTFFLELTATYIFYYSGFLPALVCSILLQGFVRNDGSPAW